jgi:hypothetical protein
MIYLIHVWVLINNGNILSTIERFGKLLIQLIGQKVKLHLFFLVFYWSFIGRWDSNIPLDETINDNDDDNLAFVRNIYSFEK